MDDREIKIAEAEEEVGKQELLAGDCKYPVSMGYAALVTGCVFGFVALGLILFDAPLELMFLLSWIVVVPLLMRLGYAYGELQQMAWDMATASFEPNVVLIVIGAMIAVWIASGTIPLLPWPQERHGGRWERWGWRWWELEMPWKFRRR